MSRNEERLEAENASLREEVRRLTERVGVLTRQVEAVRAEGVNKARALEQAALQEALRAAAATTGLAPSAVSDALARISGQPGIEWKSLDGRLTRHRDGHPDLDDQLRPVTVADAVRALRNEASHLFAADTGAGAAPANPAGNPWTREAWNITQQAKIRMENAEKAAALAAAAGCRVDDVSPPGGAQQPKPVSRAVLSTNARPY